MNLEQIDTSTTAGKAEVMRLAAEGRRVAAGPAGGAPFIELMNDPAWDWRSNTYAIIAEPVGPEEVFVVLRCDGTAAAVCDTLERANTWTGTGIHVNRYIRADLSGEREHSIPVSTLRSMADRWASDRGYAGSPVDDIRALIDQPTADLAGKGE